MIPDSSTPAFSGLFLSPSVSATTAIRLCIGQQIDGDNTGQRPLMFDADGMQHQNTMLSGSWKTAASLGVTGDFILRAVVTYNDLAPWGPGGMCATQDGGLADLGAGMDSGPPIDASALDAGVPDAGAADVSGAGDAAILDSGSGGDAGPGAAPTITAISPNHGSNAAPVAVIVTGTNFVSGLTLEIGSIPATGVEVPGPTTIHATVPANIVPGTYDVVVTNPDRQSAVLPKGYTVTPGASPPSSKCGCATTADGSSGVPTMVALLVLLAVRPRRRR
jgi:MYXO-CTERM domain-containing protein